MLKTLFGAEGPVVQALFFLLPALAVLGTPEVLCSDAYAAGCVQAMCSDEAWPP